MGSILDKSDLFFTFGFKGGVIFKEAISSKFISLNQGCLGISSGLILFFTSLFNKEDIKELQSEDIFLLLKLGSV